MHRPKSKTPKGKKPAHITNDQLKAILTRVAKLEKKEEHG